MNDIVKDLHERAEQSTTDRLNEAKRHAIKNPNGQALKQVAVQEYILEAMREKREREKGCEVCECAACSNCRWQRMCHDDMDENGGCTSTDWKYEPKSHCHCCGRDLRED